MSNTFKFLEQQFYHFLKYEKRFSKNSIFSYLYDIKFFLKYLKNKNIVLKQINNKNLISYLVESLNKRCGARSLSRSLSSIKLFLNFAKIENLINKDQISFGQISNIKFLKKLPEILSFQEIKKIIESASLKNNSGFRDKTMMQLMYSSGLRVSELVNLQIGHVFLSESFLLFKGKGNKERIVPIGKRTVQLLESYLNEIRPLMMKKKIHPYLFVNIKHGEAITRKGVWKLIKNYAIKAGINKNIKPHSFRHTYASHLLSGGADLRSIQELLGHEHISTTEIYTKRDYNQIQNTHKIYHPLNKN